MTQRSVPSSKVMGEILKSSLLDAPRAENSQVLYLLLRFDLIPAPVDNPSAITVGGFRHTGVLVLSDPDEEHGHDHPHSVSELGRSLLPMASKLMAPAVTVGGALIAPPSPETAEGVPVPDGPVAVQPATDTPEP